MTRLVWILWTLAMALGCSAGSPDDSMDEDPGSASMDGATTGGETFEPQIPATACDNLATPEVCRAQDWTGWEGYNVGCQWFATTRITDLATCASEPAGFCAAYYGSLDECEGAGVTESSVCNRDLSLTEGVAYIQGDAGFELLTWPIRSCDLVPAMPCEFSTGDDAAAACSCLCD